MDLDVSMRSRRSTRGFRPDPVDDAVIRRCLELAQHTPSNCNVQPWRVTVASGAARDRLADALMQAFVDGRTETPDHPVEVFHDRYREWQIDCARRLYAEIGVTRHDKAGRMAAAARNFALFDAPHVAVVCMDRRFGVGTALTVGMWMQSFLLALTANGVQSCAMAALRRYPDTIRRVLDLPEEHAVLCGVVFGHADPLHPANRTEQPRADLDECVTWR